MHWIQRHILKELALADSKRYTELKPDGIEGNLFQYHSRDLEKQGLIDRSEQGYALTPKGKSYVANLSLTREMKRRVQPRVITMVITKNEQDEWLLFKWSRQPYRGKVSFPSGRFGFGEDLFQSAREQLRNKSGYKADLTYIGTIIMKNDADHIIAQTFVASNLTGNQGSDGLTGESFWAQINDVPNEIQLSGIENIIEWIKDPNRLPLLELAQ
jgi:ADP-ribose pyrophosphatase YjhB (NUDIX family)